MLSKMIGIQKKTISDVYATPNVSFENPTLIFYRLLSLFCMSLMVIEMVIKIIMKETNILCRVIHTLCFVLIVEFKNKVSSG